MDQKLEITSYAVKHRFLEGNASCDYLADQDYYINILATEDSENILYTVGKCSYKLQAGTNIIYYLPKGESTRITSLGKDNHLLIILAQPTGHKYFHQRFQKDLSLMCEGLTTNIDTRCKMLFEQLYHLDKSTHLHPLRATIFILEIILHQIETIVPNEQHPDHTLKSQSEKIIMAKQIIDDDLSKNYSIPTLAKQVGTNVQYLKKYFKQYYGKTVMAYITERKMEYAKSLIMTGEHLVSDVATMTGYKHAAHFTTVFKKHFGFIPNALKYSVVVQKSATILSETENILHLI